MENETGSSVNSETRMTQKQAERWTMRNILTMSRWAF